MRITGSTPKLIFLICLFSTCQSPEIFIDDTSYRIILIAGQSNTHFGIGLDSTLDKADDRIKQLGRFDGADLEIIDAVEPLHHHTLTQNRIGFGLTFSKLLADYLENKHKILIIPCGFAGSGFINNKWNRGDYLYEDVLERVRLVMEKFPGSKLIAILWHQGEADISNLKYQQSLDDFITDIRIDLNQGFVPFILGGMVPYWVNKSSRRQTIQDIIKSSALNNANAAFADPNDPFIIHKPDNSFDEIHFDASGQRELGKRYFNAFMELVENQE